MSSNQVVNFVATLHRMPVTIALANILLLVRFAGLREVTPILLQRLGYRPRPIRP